MNSDEKNIKYKAKFQKHLDKWRRPERIGSFYLVSRDGSFASKPWNECAIVSITDRAIYIFEPFVNGKGGVYAQSLFLTELNNAYTIYMEDNSHVFLDENIKFNRNKAIQNYGFLESEYESSTVFGSYARPVKNKSAIKHAKSLSDKELKKLICCKCIRSRYDLDKLVISANENRFTMEILDTQLTESQMLLLDGMYKHNLEKNKRLSIDITPVDTIVSSSYNLPYGEYDFTKPFNYENDINLLNKLTENY